MQEFEGQHCMDLTGVVAVSLEVSCNNGLEPARFEMCPGVLETRWYAQLGAGFFHRAAVHEPSPQKARLLEALATRFEPWRQRYAELSRQLRDQPFLLVPPGPPTSPSSRS